MGLRTNLVRRLDRRLFDVWRRVRRLYRGHFSLLSFIVLAFVQGLAVFLRLHHSHWQWIPFTIVCLACTAYYLTYFRAYASLLSATHRHGHFFSIYSPWGVIAFSLIFIFTAAQVLHVVQESVFPIAVGSPHYFAFVKFCIFKTVNNVSFDGLETFDFTAWRLEAASRDGRWIIYLFGLFAELILISALVHELRRLFVPYPVVTEPFSYHPNDTEIDPASITPDLIHQLRERVNSRDYSNHFEDNVSRVLISFTSPETRDIYLRLLQDTKSRKVFERCLHYFAHSSTDRRYRRCLENALRANPAKRQWIKREHV